MATIQNATFMRASDYARSIGLPASSIGLFRNKRLAVSFALRSRMVVIMGEEGDYLVPLSNRAAARLIKAGYEAMPFD